MNKPYSGNSKPFVLALFSEKDKEKVMPVLEVLEKKGLTLCGQDENLLLLLVREELIENGNWCSYQRDNTPDVNL